MKKNKRLIFVLSSPWWTTSKEKHTKCIITHLYGISCGTWKQNHCGLNLPTWMKRNARGMEWNYFAFSLVFSRSNSYRSNVFLVNYLSYIVLWILTNQTGTQNCQIWENLLFHNVISNHQQPTPVIYKVVKKALMPQISWNRIRIIFYSRNMSTSSLNSVSSTTLVRIYI